MSNSFNERSVPQKYRRELRILKKQVNVKIDEEGEIIKVKHNSDYKELKDYTINKPNVKNSKKKRYSKSRITSYILAQDGV